MKSGAVLRPGPATPVTVVGLAKSGLAAAKWLIQLGCFVRVTEAKETPELSSAAQEIIALGGSVELGIHSRRMVEDSQILVTSPGVPPQAPPVRWARELGIPVVGELELASWYCPGRIIAVTGSNGKSTVVTLTSEIFKKAGFDTVVCGNIGTPFTAELNRIRHNTVVVLEVSSFQLEETLSFAPEAACVLNVTTNHIDRHGTFERYRQAKGRIFSFQKRHCFGLLNEDDPASRSFKPLVKGTAVSFSRKKKVSGAWSDGSFLYLNLPDRSGTVCRRDAMQLQGPHHEENALAAACLAGLFGVPPEVSGEVIRSFRGLAHRQQVIGQFKGVTFINDSKSTTVAAGLSAIQSTPGQVILIAGGIDKGSDFRLIRKWDKKLKSAVLIGRDGSAIARALHGVVPSFFAADLKEAVRTAFGMAKEGESVLLSPMCTSFDMFRDFEDRGEKFHEAVEELMKEEPAAASLLPLEGGRP